MGFQDILIIPSDTISDSLKRVKRNLLTKTENEQDALSIGNLISLYQDGFFKEHGHIHEFLENSEVHFVKTPTEPRNPELEKRIQKLKAEQENEEYRKMTKGLSYSREKTTNIRDDVRKVTAQVTAVINFVLTVGGSFFFTYKAVEYALPEDNVPAQVLMGILTASIVALADLYFLIRTI